MKLSRLLHTATACCQAMLFNPVRSIRTLSHVPVQARASQLVNSWKIEFEDRDLSSEQEENERTTLPFASPSIDRSGSKARLQTDASDHKMINIGQESISNPLRNYFDGVVSGPGIWKWLHYFDVYHQYLHRFVGKEVSVVEVGVYSGGSMPMWREYFGSGCHVHGVDIQPECKVYEDDHTTIHIGDQADRNFWQSFREEVPQVDILIDDGGHTPEQQMVTLEEMLPHLRPGGIFICEDIHGLGNEFTSYISTLIDSLNSQNRTSDKSHVVCSSTAFQATIRSINLYPYMVVLEKFDSPSLHISAPKHGTQWQPFLGKVNGYRKKIAG